MNKVQIRIDPGSPHEMLLEGTTPDVGLFLSIVAASLQRSSTPASANRKPTSNGRDTGSPIRSGGTLGVFPAVYEATKPRTDREFAALVAVYRKLYWRKLTTSRRVAGLAEQVGRKLSNPSVAISDALEAGDLEFAKPGKPAKYRPTNEAIRKWWRFIPAAPKEPRLVVDHLRRPTNNTHRRLSDAPAAAEARLQKLETQ